MLQVAASCPHRRQRTAVAPQAGFIGSPTNLIIVATTTAFLAAGRFGLGGHVCFPVASCGLCSALADITCLQHPPPTGSPPQALSSRRTMTATASRLTQQVRDKGAVEGWQWELMRSRFTMLCARSALTVSCDTTCVVQGSQLWTCSLSAPLDMLQVLSSSSDCCCSWQLHACRQILTEHRMQEWALCWG